MNKTSKTIVTICLVLSGLIILDTINFGQMLMMFFLAGIIPGTHFALSASSMMELYAVLAGFVVGRITSKRLIAVIEHISPKTVSRQV